MASTLRPRVDSASRAGSSQRSASVFLRKATDRSARRQSCSWACVPPLRDFGYEEIRGFGRRAVAEAATVAPDVAEIALTLHGPNYGLDEIEAFNVL